MRHQQLFLCRRRLKNLVGNPQGGGKYAQLLLLMSATHVAVI